IGQSTPRLQGKSDDGAEPGVTELHDTHRGRLQGEGEGERRDVLSQFDRLRVDALGHPREVVRLAEAEGEPVEVVRPGGRLAVDLGTVAELQDALEADALVADAFARGLVAQRHGNDRVEIVLGQRVPAVRYVERAELAFSLI